MEGFSQIIQYGKNLQAGMVGYTNGTGHNGKLLSENGFNPPAANFVDDTRDPSVHPWGGLAATRDSMLTVLDCFLDGMALEVLQNVPPAFTTSTITPMFICTPLSCQPLHLFEGMHLQRC